MSNAHAGVFVLLGHTQFWTRFSISSSRWRIPTGMIQIVNPFSLISWLMLFTSISLKFTIQFFFFCWSRVKNTFITSVQFFSKFAYSLRNFFRPWKKGLLVFAYMSFCLRLFCRWATKLWNSPWNRRYQTYCSTWIHKRDPSRFPRKPSCLQRGSDVSTCSAEWSVFQTFRTNTSS